jgi:hypothetical protein
MQAALDSRRKQRRMAQRQHIVDELLYDKMPAGTLAAQPPALPESDTLKAPAPSDAFGLQLTPREESDEGGDGAARKQEVRGAAGGGEVFRRGTRDPLRNSALLHC